MRFEIYLDCEKEIRLPKYYNSSVKNMIYESINPKLHEKFSNEKYICENGKFDLFTFSKLRGMSKINSYTEEIIFTPPIEIILSSPIEDFLDKFGYLMIVCGDVYLGENHLKLKKLRVMEQPSITSLELIYTLSPIIVYDDSIENSRELSFHCYSPNDKEFSEIIEKDLRKKFYIIHNHEPEENQRINLSPVKVEERLFKYDHGSEIRSWTGVFILEGSTELINIAYEAGIGRMNSFGFGCFGLLKNKKSLISYACRYPT